MSQRSWEGPGRAEPRALRRAPTAAPLAWDPSVCPAAVEGLPEGCYTDAATMTAIYFDYTDVSELADTCRQC